MIRAAVLILAAFFMSSAAVAQATKATPLFQADLKDLPGREGMMVTVDFPPGAASDVHRHNAHVFVYVLEGAVVMQVKGGPRTELGVGQTFYESPDDIHVVSMNASKTAPAKILVFFVKAKGAPVTVPVP